MVWTIRCPIYSTASPHRPVQGSARRGTAAGCITSSRLRARTYELPHGYEATREAAMAAFAKSWRREHSKIGRSAFGGKPETGADAREVQMSAGADDLFLPVAEGACGLRAAAFRRGSLLLFGCFRRIRTRSFAARWPSGPPGGPFYFNKGIQLSSNPAETSAGR